MNFVADIVLSSDYMVSVEESSIPFVCNFITKCHLLDKIYKHFTTLLSLGIIVQETDFA